MRIKKYQDGSRDIWISQNEVDDWSTKWPCSTLRGHKLFVHLEKNRDLTDFTLNGKCIDCDANELNALLSDFGVLNQ